MTLCKDYKAKYLALAVEVNTYYQHPHGSKKDFERFVEFYIRTYAMNDLIIACGLLMVFISFLFSLQLKG
jgi:hypothetical protein